MYLLRAERSLELHRARFFVSRFGSTASIATRDLHKPSNHCNDTSLTFVHTHRLIHSSSVESCVSSRRRNFTAPPGLTRGGTLGLNKTGQKQRKQLQPYSTSQTEEWTGHRTRAMMESRGRASEDTHTRSMDQPTRPLLLAFDAFDTIFTPKEPVPKQYCDVARRWGFELDEQQVKACFAKAFKSISKSLPNYGLASGMQPEDWWRQIIEQTLLPLLPAKATLPSELVTSLWTRFSSNEGYMLFPDVEPFLSLIGTASPGTDWPPERTMLGIISNSDPRVRSILKALGIAIRPSLFPSLNASGPSNAAHESEPAHFAFATLSYETGNAKPSHGIFHDAVQDAQQALSLLDTATRLTRAGREPLDNIHKQFHYMYIGDDVEKDIVPALQCGWDAVLLDRNTHEPTSSKIAGDQEFTVINSLQSLKLLVGAARLEKHGGQSPVLLDESRPIEKDPRRAPRSMIRDSSGP